MFSLSWREHVHHAVIKKPRISTLLLRCQTMCKHREIACCLISWENENSDRWKSHDCSAEMRVEISFGSVGNMRISRLTLSAVVAMSTTSLRNALWLLSESSAWFMCASAIRAVAKVPYPTHDHIFHKLRQDIIDGRQLQEKVKRVDDRLSLLRILFELSDAHLFQKRIFDKLL